MARSRTALIVPALTFALAALPAGRARSAPPAFERLGQYRIVDAAGRIAPRMPSDATGRVALRPAYPPPFLLRARPFYLSGYAGATYGRRAAVAPPEPTAYYPPAHHHHVR